MNGHKINIRSSKNTNKVLGNCDFVQTYNVFQCTLYNRVVLQPQRTTGRVLLMLNNDKLCGMCGKEKIFRW